MKSSVLIAHRDPLIFVEAIARAFGNRQPVFVGCPDWSEAQWREAFPLALPSEIVADAVTRGNIGSRHSIDLAVNPSAALMVPTGGSSGKIRFASHSLQSLESAVEGWQSFFHPQGEPTVISLPLWHVGGLMQWIRCHNLGTPFRLVHWKALETGTADWSTLADASISLVPTQLKRLLQHPDGARRLSGFRRILLGGAATDPYLLQEVREKQLPVWLTYGLTEAAATVAAVSPLEIRSCSDIGARLLPHLTAGSTDQGTLWLEGDAIHHGYFPNFDAARPARFETGDLARYTADGRFEILGRADRLINSGGEKIDPAAVESAALESGLVTEAAAVAIPSREWGEAVALAVVLSDGAALDSLQRELRSRLPRVAYPKAFRAIASLPRSSVGKIVWPSVRALFAECETSASRNDSHSK